MTLTPEMEVAVKYGSHLPALLACIAVTDGPVLELGVGFFSTPHLHALCGALKRDLTSIEADEQWRQEFHKYSTIVYGNGVTGSLAHTVFLGDYLALLQDVLRDKKWSVAFIDSSPGGQPRADLFKHLIDLSEFVVVHDAQKDAENFQHIEPMLAGLNWHLCVGVFPHTLIASKTRQIPEVLIGM